MRNKVWHSGHEGLLRGLGGCVQPLVCLLSQVPFSVFRNSIWAFVFFFKSSIALVNVLNPSTAFLNVLPPLYLSFWVCSYRLAFFSLRVTSLPARWMPDRSALHCHTRADQTSAEDQKGAVAGLCSPFRAPTPSCPGLPGLHAGPLTQRHRQALCGSPILGLPSGDASQAVSWWHLGLTLFTFISEGSLSCCLAPLVSNMFLYS